MHIKNSTVIDASRNIFSVLDFAAIRLFQGYVWQANDIEEAEAFGANFHALEPIDHSFVASLGIVDVTNDEDEPDISGLVEGDVKSLDDRFKEQFSSKLNVVEWLSSHLNVNDKGRTLLTSYIVEEDGRKWLYMALRFCQDGRKVVVLGMLDVAKKEPLAALVYEAVKNVSFRTTRILTGRAPNVVGPTPEPTILSVKELLKRDFALEVLVSGGSGMKDDPFVIESCSAAQSALTQLHLLRGVGLGASRFWTIDSWEAQGSRSTREVVSIRTVRYTPDEIQSGVFNVHFDTSAVSGSPCELHPVPGWLGPSGSIDLPYELGWLHFDRAYSNALPSEPFDYTCCYGAPGTKASIYIYDRASRGTSLEEEMTLVVAEVKLPDLQDPWPQHQLGPFSTKVFLSGDDVTIVAVAVCGSFFVKLRLTHFDDPKVRSMMAFSFQALADVVTAAEATQEKTTSPQRH